MAVETAPSLSSLGGILGGIIGGEIILDQQQANCVIENLKRYNSLETAQRYEIYPAIASSRRVLKEASNSPEKIFRQGILIKTTDTGDWFYIGGISPYWSPDQLIVYQGGSQATSPGKLNRKTIDDLADKGLGAIPLIKTKTPPTWYNPPLFKNCQGTFNIFWNYLAEFQGGILTIFTNAPMVMHYSQLLALGKASLTYSSGGSYYLSIAARNDVMRPASDTYPYIYFAYGTNPVVAKSHGLKIYPGFTFDTVTKEVLSNCSEIMPKQYCSLSFLDTRFNDIDIGALVYAVLPCGTSCSQFGLAGLILGISQITIKGVQLVYLRIAQPPSDLTTTAIIEWAKMMNVYDSLNSLMGASKRFKKAVSDLSLAFPQFIATAAALIVDWVEVSYDDGLKEAEEKAKELKEMYDKVVDELAGKPPSITNRYVYNQWWKYKTRVEECAKEIILNNPDITYEELLNEVDQCAVLE